MIDDEEAHKETNKYNYTYCKILFNLSELWLLESHLHALHISECLMPLFTWTVDFRE